MMTLFRLVSGVTRRGALRGGVLALCGALLAGCGLPVPGGGGGIGGGGSVQVALLVPQTAPDGNVQALATELANAARLAAAESSASGTTVDLRVYDTAGSAARTADVTRQAIGSGAQVIVGPLYSQNANAAGLAASGTGVPVLTFSNTSAVAGGNVFVLGNTFENTADRLVGYARRQGIDRFMVVNGESTAEQAGRDAVIRAVQASGGQVVDVASFAMSQEGVNSAAPQIAERARSNGTEAVFLTSDPALALPFIARALPASGLTPDMVQFIGLTRWDRPASMLSVPGLQGGWFTLPDQNAANAFNSRYASAYGFAPSNPVSFLGYDGVIAAAALAGGEVSPNRLRRQSGFPGANGVFRFLQDNTARRALAVATVRDNAVRVIDRAPTRLGGAGF